jgi:hypothetical protein
VANPFTKFRLCRSPNGSNIVNVQIMKTNFGPGVVVTSEWLNGSQQLYFDGQVDLDWHYNPLSVLDVQRTNPSKTGFNDQYVTTLTAQTSAGGQPIIGEKEFTSFVSFGADTTASAAITYSVSPKAYYTSSDAYMSQILADATGDYLVVNYGLLKKYFTTLSIFDFLNGCSSSTNDGTLAAYDTTLGDWTCRDYVDGGTF